MLVTDGYSALFAYRLRGLVAKIAFPGFVPDYFTGRRLENFPIGSAHSDKFSGDDWYVQKLDLSHRNVVRVSS